MKKFLIALFVLFALTVTAQAAEPVRIARLPIIFKSTIPNDKTRAELETKIERAVHIPLNGTLQVAEYLPLENSAQVLGDLWQKISAADKKAVLADAMRPLAAELDADIIVCPIVHRYNENVIPVFGWYDDFVLESSVRVELIVYDRRSDDLSDKKASRMYHDTWSGLGTASYLATICFDKVIADTKLRELVRAVGR